MAVYVVCALIVSVLFLLDISLANSLKNNDDQNSVNVPLVDSLNAPLTAQLNISKLNKQIEAMIDTKVKNEISKSADELINSLIKNKTKEVEEKVKNQVNKASKEFINSIIVKKAKEVEEKVKGEVTKESNSLIETKTKEVETKVTKDVNQASKQLINSLIVNKIKEVEQNVKREITEQIASESSVALTSCAGLQTVNNGDIIKFSSSRINYGIRNISAFEQTGLFTCDRKGLYVVFASMMSQSDDAAFRIYKNSSPLSTIYVSSNRKSNYESGSGMATIELNVGDTVSVRAARRNKVIHPYSCYSLFKVK